MAVEMDESIIQAPTQAEVNRERQRFIKLVEKIDKLEEAVAEFERDHEAIDANVQWLNQLTNMRNEIESAHNTFEASINEKSSEHKTKIEQSLKTYNDFVDGKKSEIQSRVDDVVGIKEEAVVAFNEIQTKKEDIKSIAEACETGQAKVRAYQANTSKILSDAEKALSSATSAGLAREFERQKDALKKKERSWVIALVVSLFIALVMVYCRLTDLHELVTADKPVTGFVFVLNLLISFASIGAPVWLAWLATKQVGYCFRLSEDYAFKAATAASFEGFRKEIESLAVDDENESDDELRLKLLKTVLTRLDEQPLRYVDSKVHGSPFHEALLNRVLHKTEENKTE